MFPFDRWTLLSPVHWMKCTLLLRWPFCIWDNILLQINRTLSFVPPKLWQKVPPTVPFSRHEKVRRKNGKTHPTVNSSSRSGWDALDFINICEIAARPDNYLWSKKRHLSLNHTIFWHLGFVFPLWMLLGIIFNSRFYQWNRCCWSPREISELIGKLVAERISDWQFLLCSKLMQQTCWVDESGECCVELDPQFHHVVAALGLHVWNIDTVPLSGFTKSIFGKF